MQKKPVWAAGLLTVLVCLPLAITLHGCTDLDETVYSSVTAETFYRTPEEVLAAVAPVYAQLRNFSGNYHEMSEIPTDEVVIPVRGSDWFDNGVWLQAHRHTWSAANGYFNDAWNAAYTGVARANAVLETLEDAEVADKEVIVAELRALRGFYYFMLMDFFGGVPIIGDDEYTLDPQNLPARNTRQEVFNFVVAELTAAREVLPAQWGASGYGRMTKGACDAILASMYLNGGVWTKEPAQVNGQAYNSCADANTCQAAVEAADRVLNSGLYSLSSNWFSVFNADNYANPEHIFAIGYLAEQDLGLNFPHKTLHYNQLTPSPWNGYATLAETYNAFDNQDIRKQIFLVGQQYNFDTGEPVTNRQGEPLVFSPEINDITSATESEGARINKYPPDPNHFEANNGNDIPVFRLAEVYLIKAEALNELGRTGEAIPLINQVRERVFEPDQPLSTGLSKEQVREALMKERLYELFYEARRRQDLIRFGKFTGTWQFKPASEAYRIVYPIPQQQIDSNPNLTQNPGY